MTTSTTGTNVGSITLTTATKTTSTTQVNSVTNVSTTATVNTVTIGESVYMYMRSRTITFVAQGLKPNTQYYPFFNGVSVANFCTTVNNTTSSNLVTNAVGDLTGNFYLPANTFVAGSHLFMLVDHVATVGATQIPDPIYGSAEARYEANGILKNLQTQVTLNSVANTNTVVTTVNDTQTSAEVNIVLPPVIQCESWYFEYAVYSGNTYVFTLTTNSPTPPSTSTARPATGSPYIIASSVNFVSTSVGTNNTWYHTFVARTSAGGSSVPVNTYRQEWIGTTTSTRPSLTDFKPSGLAAGSSIAVTIPWTRVSEVVCPINLGFGAPTLQTTKSSAPYDPLAQSFFIDAATYPTGVYVTSISVYFRTVDQSTPVILELRNMTNGLPGSQVFPGGKSLVPGAAAAQSPDATVATVFRFDFPVFLQANNEYCFVVKSSSMGYNVWCSKIGEVDVVTKKVIDKQAFTGTMFMSENNYTWIPDSYQDIKFDLSVAVFDTNKTSDVIFRPQKTTSGVSNYFGTGQNLPLSYITTTKGSKTVGIRIPMHGLVTNDYIHITGISGTAYNNILASTLNGSFRVTVVGGDYVTILTTGNVANRTGNLVISDVFNVFDNTPPLIPPGNVITNAVPYINTNTNSPSTIQSALGTLTQPVPPSSSSETSFTVYTNIYVNEAMVDFMATELSLTSITEQISIASGTSTAGIEVPYSHNAYEVLPQPNNFHSFNEPRMIASPLNETLHATELSNNPSAVVNVKLQSQNKNVSPVIDTNGMSLMVRSYKINNQNGELNILITAGSFIVGKPYMIDSVGTTNFTAIGAKSNTVGTSFIATGVGSGTGTARLNNEIPAGVGTALAKYKSVINNTTEFNNKLMLFVTANAPAPAIIDAYIRISTDIETHTDHSWIWMPISGVYGTAFNNSPNKFSMNEWMYQFSTTEVFNVYDIKLVMRSTNNSVVPKIYGLRTITETI